MSSEDDKDSSSKKRKADDLIEGDDPQDKQDTKIHKGEEETEETPAEEESAPATADDENGVGEKEGEVKEAAEEQKEDSEEKQDVEEKKDEEKPALPEEKKEENGDKMEEDGDDKKDNNTEEEGVEKKEEEGGDDKQEDAKMKESADTTEDGKDDKEEEAKDKVEAKETPEPEAKKNPYDALRYITVTNDGRPESLIKLVALKSLFAKQLPKMPRTYIARLVFDRRHISLAILSDDPALKDTDEEVIGSICYRAFPEMRFAEIAFCAVNASHQVKGYGTKLMNLLKREGARTGIEYFITYADNYAIGYFKKQGFTKSISMPKGRYQGLIKDYDGGTMMECYVHPSIDFTRVPEMLAAQRKFILDRIRLKSSSQKVYDPLPKGWAANLEGVSRANEAAARAMAIPGMVEAGWTMSDLLAATGQGKDVDRAKNALKHELLNIIRKVEEQQFAWPFREPVDTSEVKDYLDIVKVPIDLQTIDQRIRKGDHYKSKQMLYADLILMVNNCKLYNEEASTYVQCAVSLEKYLGALFQQ